MSMELEHKTLPFEIKELSDDGYFKGYAATFGGEPDFGGDVIVRGAFTDTLAKRGKFGSSIKMLWSHQSSLPPIGVFKSIEENNAGLKVEGQYAVNTQLGKDVYALSKMGAIDSMSFGYEPVETEPGKGKVRRYLKKIELYEISPVNFPMNPRAKITAVKSLIESAKTERDLEDILRDAGLSRDVSKYIVKHMKESLFKESITPDRECLTTLRDANSMMGIYEFCNVLKSMNNFFEERILEKSVIPFSTYSKAPEGEAWDAGAEVDKANTADLKKMCAWYDSSNPDVKSSYKLPHHKADGYSVVWRGVAAAMGAILGARGGVQIPSSDRRGVYNHLAKHYSQFEKDVPNFS